MPQFSAYIAAAIEPLINNFTGLLAYNSEAPRLGSEAPRLSGLAKTRTKTRRSAPSGPFCSSRKRKAYFLPELFEWAFFEASCAFSEWERASPECLDDIASSFP